MEENLQNKEVDFYFFSWDLASLLVFWRFGYEFSENTQGEFFHVIFINIHTLLVYHHAS